MSDHSPRTIERHCDVAVIGGSAAGLAAALQLGRQRRSVIVVDAGEPRNAPAAHMHGYLGHEGGHPSELIAIGREEVRSYGGEVSRGECVDVTRTDDGRFRVELDRRPLDRPAGCSPPPEWSTSCPTSTESPSTGVAT
jgi:thioredoxin reductase